MSAATKKTFLQGAVILGVAGLIIKGLGAVFRIPLGNIIGDTGMGYYQTAYPIYVLLLILSNSGIPVAVSRMVSERNAIDHHYEAYRVFRVAMALLACIGLVSAAFLFFGAEFLVGISGNPNARLAMMSIAPALFFVPIMAAYRGFFQGQQDMKPTAVSQVTEQFFRVAVGLTLAIVLAGAGLEYAAAGASFGATAGSVAGLAAVAFIFLKRREKIMAQVRRDEKRSGETTGYILKTILVIAVPITIGAAIMPIMNVIDLAIVMRRLQAVGFTAEAANSLYGQLTGFAGPLINIPQVLTQAVAMSLVPAVAAAFKRNDLGFLRHNVELGLRVSLTVGLPCAVGLMALSEPIMLLLYPMEQASAANAASCLFILSFGVIFLAAVQTLTGVLQGVGKQNIPVRNLCIGAVAKVALTYGLTGITALNVRGAAIGTVAAYIIAGTLNLLAVRKYTGARFDPVVVLWKPLGASLVMWLCVWLSTKTVYPLLYGCVDSRLMANGAATVITICLGAAVYGVMLVATRAITSEEIRLLPGGARLARVLERFGR
ncbi:MAG: polysaccharide biosynthesis protein [Bacillota bacterium]|nr:polysaccharide biosynthesis protein [Bacillota bacterium]